MACEECERERESEREMNEWIIYGWMDDFRLRVSCMLWAHCSLWSAAWVFFCQPLWWVQERGREQQRREESKIKHWKFFFELKNIPKDQPRCGMDFTIFLHGGKTENLEARTVRAALLLLVIFERRMWDKPRGQNRMWDAGMRIEEREYSNSVWDRSTHKDRIENEPRPVRPILQERRSRFGPVNRPSVGLCPSLMIDN